MLLYIIRHGEPIYETDTLTPLGKRQAEAVARRLSLKGLDRIYTSPLGRARLTAQPTAEILHIEPEVEEWASESVAWEYFSINGDWVHFHLRSKMCSKEVLDFGSRWYDAPIFDGTRCKEGYFKLLEKSDAFFLRHHLRHDSENGYYIAEAPNNERIAMFCHYGFGTSWIAALLDIPLPLLWAKFDFFLTGLTVIEFNPGKDGICIPKVLTHSNESHLFREGLPVYF